jgi:hypothetical protein
METKGEQFVDLFLCFQVCHSIMRLDFYTSLRPEMYSIITVKFFYVLAYPAWLRVVI